MCKFILSESDEQIELKDKIDNLLTQCLSEISITLYQDAPPLKVCYRNHYYYETPRVLAQWYLYYNELNALENDSKHESACCNFGC